LHIFLAADEVAEIRFVLSNVLGGTFEDRVKVGTGLPDGNRDEQESCSE
jgi:hypothetical protein